MNAFVLATDGLLYRDPVISGAGWHVVFDGYDDPELVIEAADLTPAQATLRAVSILEQSGLVATINGPARLVERAYDRSGDDRRDSYCFWLRVSEPIPRDSLPAEADGVTQPTGEALVISFGQTWG